MELPSSIKSLTIPSEVFSVAFIVTEVISNPDLPDTITVSREPVPSRFGFATEIVVNPVFAYVCFKYS